MSGLLAIARVSETVNVQGVEITVFGVSLRCVADLLARFPELRALFSGREVGAEAIIAQAPEAVAAIIAAGIGKAGDVEQEAAAENLGIEDQADLLAGIIKATLPNGPDALLAKLKGLMGSAFKTTTDASAATAPGTNSPKSPKR